MKQFPILLVDDDPNDINLLEYAAQAAGLTECLISVKSGQEALDYLQGQSRFADRAQYPLPSLILQDLRMPRMNGFDVVRWIRARPEFNTTVIIILTASAHPSDVSVAAELGANAFVQKPTSQSELVQFLLALKAFWMDFHELPAGMSNPEAKYPGLVP